MQSTASASITDDQLRATWRAIKQPGWGDFDHCMANPIRSRVIRIAAITMVNRPHPGKDCKRAAANDQE